MLDEGLIALVISAVAASIAAGALIINAKSFLKIRKTEQIRLVEGILRDVRSLAKEYNLTKAMGPRQDDYGGESYQETLNRLLDHTFGALNWFAYLVEINEIKDPKLVFYFRGAILKWHRELFIPNMGEDVKNPNSYPSFKRLVEKYKKELQAS